VWSWDFVFDRTDHGRTLKLMLVIDEYTRQCLAIQVARRIRARDAIGYPSHLHHARKPLGERLLRVLQWQAAR
jgi:hypothetical protein